MHDRSSEPPTNSLGDSHWVRLTNACIFQAIGDDHWAVFHPRFSDSTLLSAIDFVLLRGLLESDSTVPESDLIRATADACGFQLDATFEGYCHEALLQLSTLGLISSVAV